MRASFQTIGHALSTHGIGNVSRETFQRFHVYETLLVKWNQKINLVAASTIPNLWTRHFVDSLQLMAYASSATKWLDIGSGAGFPGIVLAILATEQSPKSVFTLIESSAKKCQFLRCVKRELDLKVNVLETRCEQVHPLMAEAITARAVAPLPKLLKLAVPHLSSNGILIFPKGKDCANEIRTAQADWVFDLTQKQSITDKKSSILIIRNPQRDRTNK